MWSSPHRRSQQLGSAQLIAVSDAVKLGSQQSDGVFQDAAAVPDRHGSLCHGALLRAGANQRISARMMLSVRLKTSGVIGIICDSKEAV